MIGADDIPSPTRGSCPEREHRPRPAGWRRRAASAARGTVGASGDGAVATGGAAAGDRGSFFGRRRSRRAIWELRQPLPGAESGSRARAPSRARGGDSRCSPTGTPARPPTCRSHRATRCVRRWPPSAARCGPARARARFHEGVVTQPGDDDGLEVRGVRTTGACRVFQPDGQRCRAGFASRQREQ